MVDVSGRDVDRLKKLGPEIKTVPGHVEKLVVSGNLLWYALVLGSVVEKANSNLL